MYALVLIVHSWLRWVVVIGGAAAFGLSLAGWLNKSPYDATHKRLDLVYLIAVDLSVTLGLLLYGVLSPITTQVVFNDFGAAMKDGALRFWAVEHLTAMLLAVVVLHVGRVFAKRAPDDGKRLFRGAVTTVLSLAIILSSIPWPWGSVARPLLRLGLGG